MSDRRGGHVPAVLSSSGTPQEEEQTRQPLTRIEKIKAQALPLPPELSDPERESGRQPMATFRDRMESQRLGFSLGC